MLLNYKRGIICQRQTFSSEIVIVRLLYRKQPLSFCSCNEYGVPCAGDKIDVFDERSCRRVFNMTFDPEMRFTSIKLTSAESQQKTLFMLTDAGKVGEKYTSNASIIQLYTTA